MEANNESGAGNPPAKKNLLKTTAIVIVAGLGVAGAVAAGVKMGVIPASWVAACFPCRPCNPCGAKNPCNPCAATNPCNPCAATNPCNPCAAANPCNPCAAANPCNPCAAQ